MKTFHVHVRVKNLEESINFYNALFSIEPTVKKDDYAKWMLKDPKVNFAISNGHAENGIEHLGIQTDSPEELQEVYKNMEKAKGEIFEEGDCSCCYSKSEKSWITDPQGVDWEAFFTYGESTVYGEGRNAKKSPEAMDTWKKDEAVSECDGSCSV
ncbi:ArsI/CadI family heavy metal resistance metalloenzyme [Gramella sp. KN1008]|uniref:ArsI/CadI family heavy metal resistance metalloenzyme n=1 Tax=Gramella sp. KN1008 TaxID=2529298 RepID=UPI001A93FF4D|nr:ArsI/CadI family heavy metal resistance metalloenzyme [Gramella sp. KN1008]